MKLKSLIEAKVDKSGQIAQLVKGLPEDKLVSALSQVLFPNQIDRLHELLGMGSDEGDVEFIFKMLMKGIPAPLKVEEDEVFPSGNKTVKALEIKSPNRRPVSSKPLSKEMYQVLDFIELNITIYYFNGFWRAGGYYWDANSGKSVSFKRNEKVEPAKLLAALRDIVPKNEKKFEEEMAKLKERQAARKQARTK